MLGVIVANTGSPSSPEPDAIEAYLREFLMDDRIRQMPKPLWKWLLNSKILPKRKFSSAERYRFIWTEQGSPLITYQRALASKVQRLFDADETFDGEILVRSAMSYGTENLEGALQEIREWGADRVVLLPLYPQSAYSPTLAVVDAFWRAQDRLGWHPDSQVIDNYHDHPAYIDLMASSIRDVGFDASAGDRLIFSLHAIPLKDEKAGDSYRAQITTSVDLIAHKLGIDPSRITVAYQSTFGPDASKWTSPLTVDVLKSWRNEGFRVVLACPGFAIDCLETLYDIPHEMVPALEGGDTTPIVNCVGTNIQSACNTRGRFIWVPTPNDSDAHASMVKSVIESALTGSSTDHVQEGAC